MADIPEIPEAKDRFEKLVAVTIAVLAIVLSILTTHADNAKTHAILLTNLKTDQWGYYQAKSIKENILKSQKQIVLLLDSSKAVLANRMVDQEIERYHNEQEHIKEKAEKYSEEAEIKIKVAEQCDLGILILQIAIVLSSVAILSRWKLLWIIGLIAGLAGAALGFSSYFL